jgi:uridine kinase
MNNGDKQVKIIFNNGKETTCYPGTTIRNILKKHNYFDSKQIFIGALVNNCITSLNYPIELDSNIYLLTIEDSQGWRIYRNSITFLLSKAVYECYPNLKFEIAHSLGSGFFCSFENIDNPKTMNKILAKVESYMHKLVEDKLNIARKNIYLEDALFHFASRNREDKCNLLRFQNPSKVPVYQCGNFMDLEHGILTENTKYLIAFKLLPYESGFIIQFPEKAYPIHFEKFKHQSHLFNIFKSYKSWGKTIGVQNVGSLNEIIIRGNYRELVGVEEAYQEKNIAVIADKIFTDKDKLKWILIAGPSSSGKTTFAHRLSTQLKVNGIQPFIISVDNYFVDRADTPRDKNGDYDFEHIETIDLELLHDHLAKLDNGEEIEMPTFDFKLGKKVWGGKKVRIEENEIAVIEGIHSLNPRMTASLPNERKFKIYINALTQLNIDNNNRISTTDNRLMRRILRDHRTRGNRALATLKMWPNVRDGEKRWIFPFQHHADMAFSSALNYEIAVLKPLVEPLLAEVKPWHEQYSDVCRLQHLLSTFISAPISHIPFRSLIREFIGGGILG